MSLLPFLINEMYGPTVSGYSFLPATEARGGVVVVCWHPLSLTFVNVLQFSITVHISSEEDGSFYLTAVYGPNDENLKDAFLAELTAVRASLSGPWLIIGDFNMIADINRQSIARFHRFITN